MVGTSRNSPELVRDTSPVREEATKIAKVGIYGKASDEGMASSYLQKSGEAIAVGARRKWIHLHAGRWFQRVGREEHGQDITVLTKRQVTITSFEPMNKVTNRSVATSH